MKIDGNELAILQNDLDRRGQKQEAWKVKQEFLKQVRESGDHCPCQEKCPHHGNSKVSPSSAFWRKTPSAHKESVVNQEEMCYLL